jgi:subtilisin family serine protease
MQDTRNAAHAPFPDKIEGGGIVLVLTPDEVYFETNAILPEHDLDQLLSQHKLQPIVEKSAVFAAGEFNRTFPDRRWVRILGGVPSHRVIEALLADPHIRLASPVYHRPDLPFKTGLTFADRVLVKLHPGNKTPDPAELARIAGTGSLGMLSEMVQADGVLVRLSVPDPKRESVLHIVDRLARHHTVKEARPDWLSLTPSIAITTPNDALFAVEWDMKQIGTPQGWDISEGNAGVVIAIVDTGCDLNHEDLAAKYVPLADRRDVVAGTNTPNDDFGHGTCCASLAAATTDNGVGCAGVSWNCRIMPIKLLLFGFINSEADIVTAINWAWMHGAKVISMSWFWPGPTTNADVAIAAAAANNVVLTGASGNFNTNAIVWPARNLDVMAIGASDRVDQRKRPASPDGEVWGSDFGPQQSVMAPGVQCWAANNTNGGASFNNNNGGPINWAGVNYPSSGTADQKYFALMNGTSAATPHVAGLAALLFSAYPGLSNQQVRKIIEQTAEKTGGYAYVEDAVHRSGTWNQEPGYGRISVFHALDFADVMIRDWPGDAGTEPSSPPGGDFWDQSDIVVRPSDDHLFLPAVPALSDQVVDGHSNYIYVQIENLGPHSARNVVAEVRLTPNLGASFTYPADWTLVDATHVKPRPVHNVFANILPGRSVLATFVISEAQCDQLGDWFRNLNAQPSLLAVVMAENDYAFAAAPGGSNLVEARNNLAQRNLAFIAEPRRREPEEREEREERAERELEPVVELAVNIKVRGREATIEIPNRHRH